MTDIAELIDPDTAERLRTVAALNPNEPAKRVIKGRGQPDIIITKASTDPNPPRTLTAADAVTIPEGMTTRFQTECVDCGTTVYLDPNAVDDTPRVPICVEHAQYRATYAAIVEQRQVQIVRRDSKETKVIDLNNMPDAALGGAVKKSIRAEKAKKIKKAQPKAKAKQVKADKQARKRLKAEQGQRVILPGFRVDAGLVIPDLDLTICEPLDEIANGAARRPYNQARFRLLGEPALDPETTTFGVLAQEHVRLAAAAKAKRKDRKKAKGKKAGKPVVAALDVSEQAKKLAAFTGVSEKRAMELLSR